MPTYELWRSPDGTERLLLPADHPDRARLVAGGVEGPLLLEWRFEAEDWDEACRVRDARAGWEGP